MASDEIKSASYLPALAGFHHMRIPLAVYCVIRRVRPTNSKFHPRSGFIPTKADLVKKDCNFVSKFQSFFGAVAGRMYEPDLREKAESICLSVSVMVSVLILCGSMVSVKL